jgi:hypothetical protein
VGGYGSGRFVTRKKTDDCLSVDIRTWRRDGVLGYGLPQRILQRRIGNLTVRIWVHIELKQCTLTTSYHRDDGTRWDDADKVIHFDFTPCHYGYSRTWFLCPACGRRVAILYNGVENHWLCRKCSGLHYHSQSEAKYQRLRRRIKKIDNQLDGGQKPRNMQKQTYASLKHQRAKTQAELDAVFVGMVQQFWESLRERTQ